ncbi:uncharacterized protein LOC121370303 isoform X2 [Gigantopelta aegis]|uniref:uncharacterized protein LOC121370303 isoform X2 n=1 Tax=Gigantopelta aegis TaxID=1735272 RepID=UPI001B88D1FB|nr:uncharacterized protein LOC121370303 isoform X2 [Gigantopelta aegis]
MAGTLKGSLGLKSSPLAPTSAKLTSQYLVLDHMNNHYNKIAKARPAIDNQPPKSMLCSQKVRERKQREQVIKYGRPLSSMSMRSLSTPANANYYTMEDETWGEPEDDEDRLVYNIMKRTLQQEPEESAQATYGSDSHDHEHRAMEEHFGKTVRHGQTSLLRENLNKLQRPCSARSSRSVMSNASRTILNQAKKPGTYDGDLLEKRAHVFTQSGRAFTPRTLKSNRQSRLKEYKYYTPPPKKNHDGDMEKEGMGDTGESPSMPRPKPRKLGDTQKGEMMETTLMFESLQSRDYSYLNKKRQEGVPTLNISVDKDHKEWLKEQANKAHVRMKSDKMSSCREAASEGDTNENGKTFLGDENVLTFGKSSKLFDKKPWKSQRLSEVEEEQLYVKFAQDITKDVLNSGICSDKVLQQMFDRHLQKNQHVLKMTRMRTILSKLRIDLGIRRDSVGVGNDLGSEMTTVSSLEHHDMLHVDSGTNAIKGNDREHSETSSTSYKFDETTEIVSTVRSQRNDDELDGLSTGQALEQYQMDITRADNESRSEADIGENAMGDRMVNGHVADLKSRGDLHLADSDEEILTPTNSQNGTPWHSVHVTPSTSSHSMHGTPMHSVSTTPTRGPRPRPRDRRHAARGKKDAAADDECSSVKGSEASICTSDQKINIEPHTNDTLAKLVDSPKQVDSATNVTRPRARARRHHSREDSLSAAEEELSHHVRGSEPPNSRNVKLNAKNNDGHELIQQEYSSPKLADKLHTSLSIHDSQSKQNQDIVCKSMKHDAEGDHESVTTKEEHEQDDYDDDYEDDYDADEDDAHGDTTHRTSDDDF